LPVFDTFLHIFAGFVANKVVWHSQLTCNKTLVFDYILHVFAGLLQEAKNWCFWGQLAYTQKITSF
jgi:hypothetical protein